MLPNLNRIGEKELAMLSDFDLIVAGGGPAGSTLATFVAMRGYRVLLLESKRFPRYQIGESLLPATINGICALLGVGDKVKQVGFLKKLGGTFRWGKDSDFWSLNFGYSPMVGDPSDSNRVYTYQVERAQFDEILLKNAQAKGVEVQEEHSVRDILMENDRIVGVRFSDVAGREKIATARFVADASGQKSRISRIVGKRIYSKFFRNVAIYCYYNGGKRLPKPNDGNTFFEAFDGGWLWYIPLSENLTSVGAVLSKDYTYKLKGDHDAAMENFIAACPTISEYLSKASRSTEEPYAEIRIGREFSYCNSHFWKPGFVQVGDSACFIDVLLSSGVHLATYSALLAARSINTILCSEMDENRCFNEFELRYRLEFSKFYQLLVGLYDPHKSSQTYHNWLRFWLRETNAFSLEPLEQDVESLADLKRKQPNPLKVDSFKQIQSLRSFNRELLHTVEEPMMMEQIRALPYTAVDLIPSPDRLHWLGV